MGARRRDVLVAVASLLIVLSCGDGGGGGSPPATTTLPLQEDALAVGSDARERARDVVETRMTEDQLRQVTQACRKAKITDGKDPCVQLLKEIAASGEGRCRPGDVCLTLYDASGLDASDLDSSVVAFMEIIDPRPNSLCASGPGNVCLRAGLVTSGMLDQIVASAESTPSPDGTTTSTSTSPETTPATPPATTSPSTSASTSASTSVPGSTSAPEPTSASTTPP
jgi:hypothetical protein